MHRKGLILGVMASCFLVVMMDNTILNVALEDVQRSLHAGNSQLQWALDSYIVVYAALMFSAGVLADSFGRRRALAIGLAVFAIGSALSAWASSPEQLILWRAVMGVGGSVVPAATLAIINQVFPKEERAKAIGVWTAVAGLSIAFGPMLGGLLLRAFWWGSVFLINVPVVAVCVALMFRYVPESRAHQRQRIDAVGVVLSITGVGALVFGVIRGGETAAWTSPEVIGSVLGGLAVLAAFVWWEARVPTPALKVSLLRNPVFATGTGNVALSFFALTGGTFLLVFYARLIRGFTPLELGLALLPVAAGTVSAAVMSAPLAGRFGARRVVTTGLLLLTAAFTFFGTLTASTPIWMIEIALAASGLGLGSVMGTTVSVIMAVVPDEEAAVGAAVNNTLRQVGAALGIAVLGSALSLRYRHLIGPWEYALPQQARAQATDSLGGAMTAGNPASFIAHAKDAYLAGMRLAALTAVAFLVLGTLSALRWLPGLPGTARDRRPVTEEAVATNM